MKIVIAAGGTGGHIYPGIALAQEISRRGGKEDLFFIGGAEGLEKGLVESAGFSIRLIRARALLRKLSYKAVSAPFVTLIGFFQSIIILRKFKPKIVVATGGYVSLPVVLAARMLRLPVVLLEQNVLPGFVNRFCARFADKVFLSFAESKKYLQGEAVGNPVRREIGQSSREAGRRAFNLPLDKKVVLVVGGSQGARKINQVVLSSLGSLPADVYLLHVTGRRDAALGGKETANYRALPYIDDVSKALAAADLIVSRAGATAIAEFLVQGLPMVLIPFPYAAGDHQMLNAKVLAQSGCARVVEEKSFSPEKFLELIAGSAEDYDKMKQACKLLAKPQAAKRIVDYLYEKI